MPFALTSPWFLLAGLGVALPILIHLLQRRREVVLPFSMVRFVLLARRRSSRRLQLRRLFLLFLRMAVILLFAFILARPKFYSPADVFRTEEPGFTAVVLDNSLSMSVRRGGRKRFEFARGLTTDIVSRSGEGEKFILIEAVAGGAGRALGWTERGKFLDDLTRVSVRPGVGDFASALGRAYGRLRDISSSERRILVFTDLARGGWEDFSLLSVAGVDPSVPVRIFHVGQDQSGNRAGLLGVEVRGENRVAGEVVEIAVQVANFGPGKTLPLELWLEGRLLDRKLAEIAPGEVNEVVFETRPPRGGAFRGELRLGEDLYPEDDRRYFGLMASPPLTVLLVDGEPRSALIESETFFFREALRPERLSVLVPIAATVVSPEGFSQVSLERFQVVVLTNLASPGPAEGVRLADFVASGGGLIIFWGGNCRPEEYRRHFPGLLPARVGENAGAPEGQPFRVGEMEYGAPMLSVFRPPGGGTFSTALFTRRAEVMDPVSGAKVLAQFGDGRPWIIRGRQGRGRILFFASTADLEWNDLATKPVYVPLMQRAVLEVSGNLDPVGGNDIVVGDPKLFLGRSDLAFTSVSVQLPSGASREVEFQPHADGVRAVLEDTGEVGYYSYSWPGREGVFAVNVPPVESDLRPLTAEDVRARFQQATVDIIPVGEDEAAGEYSRAGVRSLTRPLFVVLFFLMLLEVLVAGPRRRSAEKPAAS